MGSGKASMKDHHTATASLPLQRFFVELVNNARDHTTTTTKLGFFLCLTIVPDCPRGLPNVRSQTWHSNRERNTLRRTHSALVRRPSRSLPVEQENVPSITEATTTEEEQSHDDDGPGAFLNDRSCSSSSEEFSCAHFFRKDVDSHHDSTSEQWIQNKRKLLLDATCDLSRRRVVHDDSHDDDGTCQTQQEGDRSALPCRENDEMYPVVIALATVMRGSLTRADVACETSPPMNKRDILLDSVSLENKPFTNEWWANVDSILS